MLDVLVDLAAIAALLLSAGLALIEFRRWRAKPLLRLDMDWLIGGGAPTTLRVVAANAGQARGGIRDIVFSPTWQLDPATTLYYLPIMEQLPVMLDPGHFVRFSVELDPNEQTDFAELLLSGGHAVLVTHDERRRTFLIPKAPATTDERMTAKGRVVKR